ncbi:hypothetical protein G9464_05635 [Halostella sp. JP-L12]|uniref:hypothetical protein n=1 Tax=Halostella TaxID=1843185 RepID=UPI000EF811F3|nr:MULTISPECIES: hypothetical protein [Halostella]NHN47079.1 hypothetical protein [Halostella sp. JP-L12]
MAGRRPDYGETSLGGDSLRLVGRRAAVAGAAVCALALPVALAAAVALFGAGPAAPARAAALLSAEGAFSGLELVFRAAALCTLAGAWLLGAGLVIEGLFE